MRWLPLMVALLGCSSAPAGELDAGTGAAGVCSASPTREVDLLFVVEGHSYVQESQGALVQPLEGFLRALTTGDLDGDGVADQPAIETLHAGVVTSDMGALGNSFPTCTTALGDDGVLRTDTPPWAPAPPGGPITAVHQVTAADDLAVAAARLSAVIQTGNDHGCGFEQPLEATLKALSPSAPTAWTAPGYAAPRFWMGMGHGDGANAGLVREETALVVVILASEEDLSAAEEWFLDPEASAAPLSTRYVTDPSGLHPVERYVEGLLALRGDPARIVLGLMIGAPPEADPEAPIGALLDDPRMQHALREGRPVSVCDGTVPYAYPGRRLLETAVGLEAAGADAVVSSVCERDQRPLFAALARAIGRALVGTPCD